MHVNLGTGGGEAWVDGAWWAASKEEDVWWGEREDGWVSGEWVWCGRAYECGWCRRYVRAGGGGGLGNGLICQTPSHHA